MRQLSFNLQTKASNDPYSEEDFIVCDDNSSAVGFLSKFFTQAPSRHFFSQARFPSMILRGGSGSGKTHLLHIFAKKSQACFLDIEKISDANLAETFVAERFYILEDIDKIENEELLLHIINSAFEAKAFLIMSSKAAVKFQLKDLMSRLRNVFCAEIKNPSPDLIKQLLVSGFSRKQIKLSGQIINFIADHIERTYSAVWQAISMVENHCQESGKNITMREVSDIFKK